MSVEDKEKDVLKARIRLLEARLKQCEFGKQGAEAVNQIATAYKVEPEPMKMEPTTGNTGPQLMPIPVAVPSTPEPVEPKTAEPPAKKETPILRGVEGSSFPNDGFSSSAPVEDIPATGMHGEPKPPEPKPETKPKAETQQS